MTATDALPLRVYERLYAAYGPQGWWPASSAFGVMVGAVLTQNTTWTQVERAMSALEAADALSPEAILALAEPRLEQLLRPAGTYRLKARRLRVLCDWLSCQGGTEGLRRWPAPALRDALLGLHGIGPETADAIALYAYGHPFFVIDAYTRRLFGRLGWVRGDEAYGWLQGRLQAALPEAAPLLNEYHALIVRHAKARCRASRPHCAGCPLSAECRYASRGLLVDPAAAKLSRL